MSNEAIATRFNVSTLQVRRRLALGRLAPEVREAWRAGKITEETAKAFTIVPDVALQASALASVLKSGQAYPHSITQALGAKRITGALLYVGEDAYLAAGGRIERDLFSDAVYVLDEPTLDALARTKLQADCDVLVEGAGWKWASIRGDLGDDSFSWERLEPTPIYTPEQKAELDAAAAKVNAGELQAWKRDDIKRAIDSVAREVSFTAEDKARSGVAVTINQAGGLYLQTGIIKPGDEVERPPEEAQEAEAAETGPTEPRAAIEMMWITETFALADVVAKDPELALDVLLALLVSGETHGPLRLRVHGSDLLGAMLDDVLGAPDDGESIDFAQAMRWVQEDVDPEDRLKFLAKLLARSIDTTARGRYQTNYSSMSNAEAICDFRGAISPIAFVAAARNRFDPEAFFLAAKKMHALACIEECLGADEAKKWAGKKKAEIEKMAARTAEQKGWLPAYLREEGYRVGPAMTDAASSSLPEGEADGLTIQTEAPFEVEALPVPLSVWNDADQAVFDAWFKTLPEGPAPIRIENEAVAMAFRIARGDPPPMILGVDPASPDGDQTAIVAVQDGKIVEAVTLSPLPKAQRQHLILLENLGAIDEGTARPKAVEDDETAKALSPATIGALIRRELAAKVMLTGPKGKLAAYHLTPKGALVAAAILAGGV